MKMTIIRRNGDKRDQGNEMRRKLIIAIAAVAVGLFWSPSAGAQTYGSSAGWSGGVLLNTALNDGANPEAVELKPDPTWLVSAHYDQWFGRGNLGVRARGGFSMPKLTWVQGERELRVLMADVGILFRPIAQTPERSVLPFLSAGIGLINWGLGDGPPTTFSAAGATYAGEGGLDMVATAGLGVDIVTPWQWGEGPLVVRLEARDHIQFSSPFDPAFSDDPEFGMIHNAGLVLGFHTGMGILTEGR